MNFFFDTMTTFNGKDLYNIKVNPLKNKDGIHGNIFIDKKSLAFVKINIEYVIRTPQYYNGVKKSHNCTYQISGNKWLLLNSSFIGEKWYRKKGNIFKVNGNSQFVVTNISQRTANYKNTPLISKGDILSYYPGYFDSLFWENINYLLPDSTITKKLTTFKPIQPTFEIKRNNLQKNKENNLLYYPSIELWVSTQSSKNLTTLIKNLDALNGLTYYMSDRYFKKPYGMIISFLYSFGFSIPFTSVEAERRLLSKNDIKSSYNPTIYNRHFQSYSNHISNNELSFLKNSSYDDFMRLHTIREDANYLMIKQIEEKFAGTDMKNQNVRNNYLSYYYFDLFVRRIFYANNILSQFEIRTPKISDTTSNSPIFLDRQKSFVKYLYNPNDKFNRIIRKNDLTKKEQKYLNGISWKSLINWISLPMLAISFGNENMQLTGSLAYILIPFGEMYEQNLWLKVDNQTFGFFIREYKNYERLGVGAGVKFYNYNISKKLQLQTSIDYWYQPENLKFYDTKLTHGFGIGQQLQIKLKEDVINHLGDLSIFLAYEFKTKGYQTSNISLKQDVSFNVGFKYNFIHTK